MKFQYRKILIKGQSAWVIAVFLTLALGFWLTNKLADDYEATIPLEVRLKGYNRSNMIFSTDVVHIDVRIFGSGFTLLKYKLSSPHIQIALDKVFPQMNNSRLYFLPSAQVLQMIEYQLKEVQIRSISPDMIRFTAKKIIQKKLPVRMCEWVSYKEQYFSSGKQLSPDSVWVSGPETIVDTMTRVSTKLYRAKKLDKVISEKIDLDLPSSVVCNAHSVTYTNKVERYTQNVIRVPIRVMDMRPDSKVQLLPSYTEIYYKIPLNEVRQVQDTMFLLGVNFKDMFDSKSGLVKVHVLRSPIPKTSLQLKNPYVEFILFPTQL